MLKVGCLKSEEYLTKEECGSGMYTEELGIWAGGTARRSLLEKETGDSLPSSTSWVFILIHQPGSHYIWPE